MTTPAHEAPRTTVEGPPPTTVEQAQPADATPARRAGASTRVNLPDELSATYRAIRDLDSTGGEADLLVCEPLDGGPEIVAKLYRDHRGLDARAKAGIARLDPAKHVVRIITADTLADGRGYELQEYCEAGSLDRLLPEGTRLDGRRARQLLEQLVEAVEHLHSAEVDIVHRDLKPSNVLLRSVEPLDIAVADFGLAVGLGGATNIQRSTSRTTAYAAPEVLTSTTTIVSKGRDWWAVGMIMLQALSGRHPFRTAEGWFSEVVMANELALRPVPIVGVGEVWTELLSGLLTRNPKHRWSGIQVRGWLAGETVEVRDEPTAAPRPQREWVISLNGTACRNPTELAAAVAADWAGAVELLLGRDEPEFRDWAGHFPSLSEVPRLLKAKQDGRHVDRVMAELLFELDPELGPVFRGRSADRSGLLREAARAQAEAMPGAAPGPGVEWVGKLLDGKGLLGLGGYPGCDGYAVLNDRWQTACTRYRRDRQKLATEAKAHVHGTDKDRRSIEDGLPPGAATALLLRVLLDDAAAASARTAAAFDPVADGIEWFHDYQTSPPVDTPAEVHDLLLPLVQPVAREQAARRGEAEAQRARAEAEAQRAAEAAARATRDRQRAARRLGRNRARAFVLAPLAAFAIVSGAFLLLFTHQRGSTSAYDSAIQGMSGAYDDFLRGWTPLLPDDEYSSRRSTHGALAQFGSDFSPFAISQTELQVAIGCVAVFLGLVGLVSVYRSYNRGSYGKRMLALAGPSTLVALLGVVVLLPIVPILIPSTVGVLIAVRVVFTPVVRARP